ncbi:unnamed protein product [Lampetra fluviatilis]
MEDTAAESPPEMAEVGSEQPGPSTPALLRQEGGDASAEGLRLAHSRLAELLYAAAAALEEITRLGAGGAARDDDSSRRAATFPANRTRLAVKFPAITTVRAEGGAGPRQVTAEGQARAVTSSTPASASTTERPAMPCSQPAHTVTAAGNDGARSAATDVALQQRLPPLKEFVGADGDWGGFKRRFIAHQEMANWTDAEALRALPAMLDNDALATLTSAPKEKRATLHLALQLLSAVYGPPSDCRQLFHDRHRGANESPLAFRTALLALAKAAFPRMDEEGVDAMVAEKLLLLADELDVAVLAQDDAEMSSLLVARHIHGGLRSLRRKAAKGVAGHAMAATTLPSEEVCGVERRGEWRSAAPQARNGPSRQEQPRPSRALTRCYNCGLQDHVASGCRAPRQCGATPRQDAAPSPPKLQQRNAYALRVQQPSGQLSRWLEILQDYDFVTTYRKGVRHTNADALSRLPPTSECACLLGSGRCRPPNVTTDSVLVAAADAPSASGPIEQEGRDSLLGLSVAE